MSHLIKMKRIGSVNYLFIYSFALKSEWMGKIHGSDLQNDKYNYLLT